MKLSQMSYITLIDKLISSQFINEKQLPDSDGHFTLPSRYSNNESNPYPLVIAHCKIPPDQLQALGTIDNAQFYTTISSVPDTQIEEIDGTCLENPSLFTQTEVENTYELDMEPVLNTQEHLDDLQLMKDLYEEIKESAGTHQVSTHTTTTTIVKNINQNNSTLIPIENNATPSFSFHSLPPAEDTNQTIPILETFHNSENENTSVVNDNLKGKETETNKEVEVNNQNDTENSSENILAQNLTDDVVLSLEQWLVSSSQNPQHFESFESLLAPSQTEVYYDFDIASFVNELDTIHDESNATVAVDSVKYDGKEVLTYVENTPPINCVHHVQHSTTFDISKFALEFHQDEDELTTQPQNYETYLSDPSSSLIGTLWQPGSDFTEDIEEYRISPNPAYGYVGQFFVKKFTRVGYLRGEVIEYNR